MKFEAGEHGVGSGFAQLGLRIKKTSIVSLRDPNSERSAEQKWGFESGEHWRWFRIGFGSSVALCRWGSKPASIALVPDLGLTSHIQRKVFREAFSKTCLPRRVFDAFRVETCLRNVFSDTCFRSVVTWLRHVSFS